jgi:hypothetical protein
MPSRKVGVLWPVRLQVTWHLHQANNLAGQEPHADMSSAGLALPNLLHRETGPIYTTLSTVRPKIIQKNWKEYKLPQIEQILIRYSFSKI